MHVGACNMSGTPLVLLNQIDGIPAPTVLSWVILQMHMLGDEKMM